MHYFFSASTGTSDYGSLKIGLICTSVLSAVLLIALVLECTGVFIGCRRRDRNNFEQVQNESAPVNTTTSNTTGYGSSSLQNSSQKSSASGDN